MREHGKVKVDRKRKQKSRSLLKAKVATGTSENPEHAAQN